MRGKRGLAGRNAGCCANCAALIRSRCPPEKTAQQKGDYQAKNPDSPSKTKGLRPKVSKGTGACRSLRGMKAGGASELQRSSLL